MIYLKVPMRLASHAYIRMFVIRKVVAMINESGRFCFLSVPFTRFRDAVDTAFIYHACEIEQ